MNSQKKIIDAFLKVAERSSILQVLNDDVIREAQVSRGTFYNHFSGKNEILNTIEQQIGNRLAQQINHSILNVPIKQTTFYKAVVIIFNCSIPIIYQNQHILRQLNSCKLNYIWEIPLSNIYGQLLDKLCKDKVDLNRKKMLIEMVLILTETWINAPHIQSVDRIKMEFTNLFNISIENLLK